MRKPSACVGCVLISAESVVGYLLDSCLRYHGTYKYLGRGENMTDKDIDFLYSVYVEQKADPEYEKVFVEKIKLVYEQKKLSEEMQAKFAETQEKLQKLNNEK